jgi:hypothetical protein
MTAIGKLLVLSTLVLALGVLTWSTNIYVHRPGWFGPAVETSDRANAPVNFAQMKGEMDVLTRSAAVASEAWGTNLKTLEEREQLRADRKAAYAERIRWARKGNPKDLIDPDNPKSAGKGFYEPVVDRSTRLYDMSKDANGIPKGAAVLGTNGRPLPGLDGLQDSIAGDAAASVELNKEILKQEEEFDRLSKLVVETEIRAIKMGIIRDSVQSELFFLSTFEVNVFETRETVFRRERQLRDRLKILGVNDP